MRRLATVVVAAALGVGFAACGSSATSLTTAAVKQVATVAPTPAVIKTHTRTVATVYAPSSPAPPLQPTGPKPTARCKHVTEQGHAICVGTNVTCSHAREAAYEAAGYTCVTYANGRSALARYVPEGNLKA